MDKIGGGVGEGGVGEQRGEVQRLGVHLAGQLHLATLCHQLGVGGIEVEGSNLPLVEHQHQQEKE